MYRAARLLVLLGLLGLPSCAASPHAHGGHSTVATAPTVGDQADERLVELVEARCSACHSTDRIYSSTGAAADWHAVIHRMLYHHKAKLLTHVTDEEGMRIADWLAAEQPVPPGTGVRIGHQPSGRPL